MDTTSEKIKKTKDIVMPAGAGTKDVIPPGGTVIAPTEGDKTPSAGGGYKPPEYQSKWQDQLNDIFTQIQNRQDFAYDVDADALYKQYKDQYTRNGRMAMEDTMGKAATMTGGYGNSYAQNVGQQAYQGYMQGLNEVIPELYQLALEKYNRDGAMLKDQYGMLLDRESLDYGRWAADRDFGYGQHRDEIADEQWQTQFDEDVRRFNFANQLGEFAPPPDSGHGVSDEGGSSSGGKRGSGGRGGSKSFIDAATEVAKKYGGSESKNWIHSVAGPSKEEKAAAKDQASGVDLTNRYKNSPYYKKKT